MKPVSVLVVDGYNVIYGLPRFAALSSLEEKRERLGRDVELFAHAEGLEWLICFDGKKGAPESDNPHLLFSKKGEGADALIERFAYEEREKQGILCVTNDRTLADFLFGLGASILSVDAFDRRLQEIEREKGLG